jgi:hypothetical protein
MGISPGASPVPGDAQEWLYYDRAISAERSVASGKGNAGEDNGAALPPWWGLGYRAGLSLAVARACRRTRHMTGLTQAAGQPAARVVIVAGGPRASVRYLISYVAAYITGTRSQSTAASPRSSPENMCRERISS